MNAHSNQSGPENSPENLERLTATQPSTLTPTVVLSLLEADQVVAAKQQTRFGPRRLSPGLRGLLWGLRVYVVVMLVLVVISVVRALHPTP
jgi:hypothetical protein